MSSRPIVTCWMMNRSRRAWKRMKSMMDSRASPPNRASAHATGRIRGLGRQAPALPGPRVAAHVRYTTGPAAAGAASGSFLVSDSRYIRPSRPTSGTSAVHSRPSGLDLHGFCARSKDAPAAARASLNSWRRTRVPLSGRRLHGHGDLSEGTGRTPRSLGTREQCSDVQRAFTPASPASVLPSVHQ